MRPSFRMTATSLRHFLLLPLLLIITGDCRGMHLVGDIVDDSLSLESDDPKEQQSLFGDSAPAAPESVFKHHYRTTANASSDAVEVSDIHFQIFNHKASVTFTRLKLSLPGAPVYEKWEANPDQSRLETVALYPKMIFQGRYRIDRSKFFNDFDTAIVGYFRYITNFTSNCLGFLDHSENGLSVGEVDCEYHVAPIQVQFKRQKSNTMLEHIASENTFVWILQNKLWHDLTSDLDQAIRLEMDKELRKRPTRMIEEDDEERRRNETREANRFVDQIIVHARRVIFELYGDRIRLPDIDDSFQQQLVIVPVHGRVVCRDGRVEGTTSVARMGDCKLANNVGGVEGNIHYYGKLGFKQLKLIYEDYKVSILGLGPSGTLTAKLYPVEIMVHIHADYNEGTVSLDKFKVTHVGDLLIDLTGTLVGLDWLLSVIGSFIVNLVRDNVIGDLEQRYAEYIRDILSKYSLADILMENYPDLGA